MASHPIAKAVLCPCCGTLVNDVERCSWCTINLRTGSWVGSDHLLAVRELRRTEASIHEYGPTPFEMLLPADDGCGTAAGYRAHLVHGESACDDCKLAHALKKRDNRAAARQRKAA